MPSIAPQRERIMSYTVKELFKSLQGEGAQTGRAAVFCRFSGCNLWSGREADRANAQCRFCDTDFVGRDGPGGGKFRSAVELADAIAAVWGEVRRPASQFVVFTGGEPLLQLDAPLLAAMHERGFSVAVETNGTMAPPPGIDWVCVSPKAGAPLTLREGNEIKLVYPQAGIDPADLTQLRFDHFWLQPMDGPSKTRNTHLAAEYCLANPPWRLGLQTHKIIGLP